MSLRSLLMCQRLFQVSALLQWGTVFQMRQWQNRTAPTASWSAFQQLCIVEQVQWLQSSFKLGQVRVQRRKFYSIFLLCEMDSKSQGIVSSCRRFGNNWTLWHFSNSTPCLLVLQNFFLPQSFPTTGFEFRGKPHKQLSWHFMKGRLLGQESENILQNQRSAEAGRGTWRSYEGPFPCLSRAT